MRENTAREFLDFHTHNFTPTEIIVGSGLIGSIFSVLGSIAFCFNGGNILIEAQLAALAATVYGLLGSAIGLAVGAGIVLIKAPMPGGELKKSNYLFPDRVSSYKKG